MRLHVVMWDTAFTRMLGCQYPLQMAGMGGAPSPELALAVSAAGGLGMVTGTVGERALDAQLDLVPKDSIVGVNFLVPFLAREALESAAARSPFVEFFWGAPDPELVSVAGALGARVGWQVGSVDEASAAVDAGCDLVVLQGHEAGGHVRGTVALLELLAAARARVDAVLVAAGGIGTGRQMAAALDAGADAVRIGTRFLAAFESIAHPDYVERLIAATGDDTEITTAFADGWPDAPHRVLRSAIVAGQALGASQSWSPQWPTVDDHDPIEARALYAGRSVDAVRFRQPAAAIVRELIEEAEDAIGIGVE